jgi:hypothetical protein
MLSCIASERSAGGGGGSLRAMRMRALSRSNCGDLVQVVLVSAAVQNAQCISHTIPMICVEIQELSPPAFFKRKIAALQTQHAFSFCVSHCRARCVRFCR